MFRLGNLRKEALEARLKSNPWVLAEWCGDLVEAANRSSAQILEVADLEAVEVKFFTAPQLLVPESGQPYFTTSLCNLDQLDLDADSYEMTAGGQTLARLIRQADGSYYSDSPEVIALPTRPTVALSLVGDNRRITEHDEAVLWDPMDEVSVYSQKTGRMIPSGVRLRTGTGVFLIASADISWNPQPVESIDLGLGFNLHRIAPGWSGQLEGSLDGDVIWSSKSIPSAQRGDTPGVTAHFTGKLDLRASCGNAQSAPWSLPIQFHIPPGWQSTRFRWRRGDGKRVELSEPPRFLTLTEADAVRPVILRVRITDGVCSRTDVLRVSVPFVAALKWTKEGKPYHHSPDRKLMLGEAQQATWSFSLPALNGKPRDPRTCSFAEGSLLHGRLKARPSSLPNLAGFGAPLHIVDDPYRRGSSIMEVAPCVLDGGVLGSVTWNSEEGGFHLKSTFTQLGTDHRLVAWLSHADGESKVEDIPLEVLEPREDGWFWPKSEHGILHAVALSFRGTRIGSWFDFRWATCLKKTLPGSTPEVAALLRAWKAPLLQEDNGAFSRVTAWFAEHWLEILPVWLTNGEATGPDDESWPMPSISPGWTAVVREFLLASFPDLDAEIAGELVDTLAPGAEGAQAIGSAIWKMVDVSPILAARVARIYLDEFVVGPERRMFFEQMLATSDLAVSDDRAEEIARKHGNRDGFWLEHTVPNLHAIEQNGQAAISHAFRLLSKSKDFRLFALGKWLREIR